MPVYNYVGMTDRGKQTSGIVDAENEKAARAKLRKMNIYPISLNIAGSKGGGRKFSLTTEIDLKGLIQRVKTQDIATMTRQFATLLSSGIPLVDALVALEAQTENVKLQAAIADIKQKVTEGSKLSDAMRDHKKIFNDIYVNMVNAGENSGALDIVLERLAEFFEKQANLKRRVVGAMIYPIIMALVGVAIVIVLMIVVIPQMREILSSFGVELPLPTKIMIAISNTLSSIWILPILLLIAAGAFAFKRYINTEKGRLWYDSTLLKLPVFGDLFRMVAISRFARTLMTLLGSGVPLLNAMDIVRNIVGNVIIEKSLQETRDAVKEGGSIADPLKKSGQMPPMVIHMIATGEKTGQLEKMLESIANAYDSQVDAVVSSLMSVLEPVMLIIMGGIIFSVVISVMLPIAKFMGEAGNM